ncbi:hypothetical protein N7508_010495 [Penicillium antarcticum]|uniref:uncharacterized protein n=1 Tax=Penicillium antarcticum TaxID=416450 RepID=UPI00239A9BAC|nr:uncharacterized protein N7508_010495 [Penicillium antarcticum]KAJ5295674.1 hypothetical protein N7508_010495 [Penicillium antarcticum]
MPPKRNLSQNLAYRKTKIRNTNDKNRGPVTSTSLRAYTASPQTTSFLEAQSTNTMSPNEPTFVIGLDFGTTMTSVSYYKFNSQDRPATVARNAIKSITNWPHSGRDQSKGEVPSEGLYLEGKYFWGYEARPKLKHAQCSGESLNASNRLIRFAKLILEKPGLELDDTDAIREMKETMRNLGKSVKDVITDYLVEVFRYTKKHLADHEDFRETSPVELSLSVPAGWRLRTSWSMQEIVKDATVMASLGQPDAFDLFIINEPEAAAAFAVDVMTGVNRLQDVTTYNVKQQNPLRLTEAVDPKGDDFGSTCVNREMEKDLRNRFRSRSDSHRVLSEKDISIEYQLFHDVFRRFEEDLKRNFDSSRGLDGYEYLDFHGLKANLQHGFDERIGFANNMIKISRRAVQGWFQPSLEGIAGLIKQQEDLCTDRKLVLKKVILVGGYSQSNTLRQFMNTKFPHLQLIYPRDRKFEGHRYKASFLNPCNLREYATNCLNWIIKKGRVVEWNETFVKEHYQIFEEGQNWEIREQIYYSEKDGIKDHYTLEHEMNKGVSEPAGMIVVDLTELMTRFDLQLICGEDKKYYEIHYDLITQLTGRNLTVSLRYPPGEQVRASTQVCIAASFEPGAE